MFKCNIKPSNSRCVPDHIKQVTHFFFRKTPPVYLLITEENFEMPIYFDFA